MAAASEFISITCRVTPNARRSEFIGWGADEKGRPVLMVKLQAPPVEGKANTELLRFLADALDCAKSQVTLVRGETSRTKVVGMPAAAALKLPAK
jgi:hypothetical protein